MPGRSISAPEMKEHHGQSSHICLYNISGGGTRLVVTTLVLAILVTTAMSYVVGVPFWRSSSSSSQDKRRGRQKHRGTRPEQSKLAKGKDDEEAVTGKRKGDDNEEADNDTIRIAFLGNSILYYNDCPRLVEKLLKERYSNVVQNSCLRGGVTVSLCLCMGFALGMDTAFGNGRLQVIAPTI